MNKKDIVPQTITKPMQLLAGWLAGLIAIDGSFLTAATMISEPSWVPAVLVSAAIVNVPIFLLAMFLLQTRFRPEMQEDTYYAKYLEMSRQVSLANRYDEILVEHHQKALSEKISEMAREQDEASQRMLLSEIRELDGKLVELRARVQVSQEIASKVDIGGKVGQPRDLKILLAEDNYVHQRVIESMLSRFGYIAESVSNGTEAVRRACDESYDIILMDVAMPELDGRKATQRIREFENAAGDHRHVPIIAMTAHAMKSDREWCLSAGMDDYITKPIRVKDLMTIIEKYSNGNNELEGRGSDMAARAEEPPHNK